MKLLSIVAILPSLVLGGEVSGPKAKKIKKTVSGSTAPGDTDVGPQSQYAYITSSTTTPTFEYNISLTADLSIGEATDQGIYPLSTSYLMADRSYDVELFKKDCVTAPSGLDSFPLVFDSATETASGAFELDVELEYVYNQTKMELSDLWTATTTGGYSEFCIRVNNYIEEAGEPFSREINFLEVIYKITVESLTEFETTIDIEREDATDGGTDAINYEEDLDVYQCYDDYSEIPSPPALFQGDFLQICIKTVDGSKFGIHSVKELDVDQAGDNLYPYVDGFLYSPLTASMCTDSNTTAAVCKVKMQLISAYFDFTDPEDLSIEGVAKLDYVGRRLSVDIPINALMFKDKALENGRDLEEESPVGGFGLEVQLASTAGSDASVLSIGGVLSAALAFFAAGLI